MSQPITPSPMLGIFVGNIRENFPATETKKLTQFEAAIAKTSSAADKNRAHRCLVWAVEKANDKSQSHPRWRAIHELHQEWKDTWLGVEMGFFPHGGPHTPLEDIHIRWIEDAAQVAQTLGEEDGWDHSPWEELLQQLIDMEKSSARQPATTIVAPRRLIRRVPSWSRATSLLIGSFDSLRSRRRRDRRR